MALKGSVLVPGPPEVSAKGMAKTFRHSTVRRSTAIVITGQASGIARCHITCQWLFASSTAAS